MGCSQELPGPSGWLQVTFPNGLNFHLRRSKLGRHTRASKFLPSQVQDQVLKSISGLAGVLGVCVEGAVGSFSGSRLSRPPHLVPGHGCLLRLRWQGRAPVLPSVCGGTLAGARDEGSRDTPISACPPNSAGSEARGQEQGDKPLA